MDENISDAELCKRLRTYGFEPGPITGTTRSVYLKKLKRFASENESTTRGTCTAAADTVANPKKSRPVKRSSVKTKTVSNSSDENEYQNEISNSVATKMSSRNSEIPVFDPNEDWSTNRRSMTRGLPNESGATHNGPTVPSNARLSSYPRTSFSSLTIQSIPQKHPVESKAKHEEFRPPSQVSQDNDQHITRNATPQRGAGHTPTRKTFVYYKAGLHSESETDDDSDHPNAFQGTVSRVTGWLRGSNQQPVTPVSTDHTTTPSWRTSGTGRRSFLGPRNEGQIEVSDTDYSDADNRHSTSHVLQRFRKSLGGLQSPFRETGTATSTSLLFTPPRMTDNHGRQRSDRPAMSILSDDADSDGTYHQPHRSEKLNQSSSSGGRARLLAGVVSHVPNLILIGSVVALALLCFSYFILRDHHGEVGKMADLQRVVCGNAIASYTENTVDFYGCILQQDLTDALPILSITYDILSRYAGEYRCGQSDLSSPRMSVFAAQRLVEHELRRNPSSDSKDAMTFLRVWKHVLFLLIHVGKVHFKLVGYDSAGALANINSKPGELVELESLQPYYSGMCRVRLWIGWLGRTCLTLFWTALAIALLVGLVLALRWARNRRLQFMEQKNARIRDLVADLVHMLQQQLRENETNAEKPPYVPVYVLRDGLRQLHTDALDLWPDIQRYIYEVETCIGVREWRGIGETWQWQGGTGWQGSALVDKSQKPPFTVPPTECLKVRNMFSTEGLDERGKRRIKRELLKKLASCGPIVHIGLDNVGTKGLVYVKCINTETAGRVYHNVHANYFDGRLLTVKFLRDTKYCLRFPESHGAHQPLSLNGLE